MNVTGKPWQYLRPITVFSSFFEMNHTKLALLEQVQIFWICEALTQAPKIAKKLFIAFLSFPTYYFIQISHFGLVCVMGSVTVAFLAMKDKAFL